MGTNDMTIAYQNFLTSQLHPGALMSGHILRTSFIQLKIKGFTSLGITFVSTWYFKMAEPSSPSISDDVVQAACRRFEIESAAA
jgi:hypothetical protein